MNAMHQIQVLIVLVLSIRSTVIQIAPSTRSSVPMTKRVVATTTTIDNATTEIETHGFSTWLIIDQDSCWDAEEVEILKRVLQNTFDTLAANGIDGMVLLDGYRFRHKAGRYIDQEKGFMASIDHNKNEITLSDMAFTVQDGFAIYHELGHAIDYRLDRQLSEGFHRYTGGAETNEDGKQWKTADNYWLRLKGRDDREEATADAFAVLVMMTYAVLKRPVFAHQPITTDYDGISAALALALQTIELPR
jgi:hypothetical protein